MALRHSVQADAWVRPNAEVSRREHPARPAARSADVVPQARPMAHRQAVPPLRARGLRPVPELAPEEAESSAQPAAEVQPVQPLARAVLSEPQPEAAAEVEQLSAA
jgi:hypothetical protein